MLFAFVSLLLAFVVIWLYRKDVVGLSRGRASTLLFCRLAALAVLGWIWLDPRERVETDVLRPSRVALVLDQSQSMETIDSSATRQSRSMAAADWIAQVAPILASRHEVSVYGFGQSAWRLGVIPPRATSEAPPQLPNLQPESLANAPRDETRVGDSLNQVLQLESSFPLSAVILLSDGRSTGGGSLDEAIERAVRLNTPIHAVGFGAEREPLNIRLADLRVPSRVFKGDQVKVTAHVLASELPPGSPMSAEVELLLEPRNQGGTPKSIGRRSVSLAGRSAGEVEFRWSPETSGAERLVARLAPYPREERLEDNSLAASVDVVDRKTKVLLWAGGPTREYRFVRGVFFRDSTIELDVHLQSSPDVSSQDAQRVLREFPSERAMLFAYDAIIAFDPDWSTLARGTRDLLAEWLGARSGGLVLVAGPIHSPRLARDASLADILPLFPVGLREVFSTELDESSAAEPWRLVFTVEGQGADFLRLSDDPLQSRRNWGEFAGFCWSYPISSVKPGATVLARWSEPRARAGGELTPTLVSQFYGSGRVLYVGSGELWRLRREDERAYERLWIQLLRHVAQARIARGAARGEILLLSETVPLFSTVSVEARLLGQDFRPLTDPALPLSIQNVAHPDAKPVVATITSRPEKPGAYAGQFVARDAGEFRLRLTLPGGDLIERTIRVQASSVEREHIAMDRMALEQLTRATGGRLVDDRTDWTALIEDRTERITTSSTPLAQWDRVWVMVLFALLLSTEWLLRKLVFLA